MFFLVLTTSENSQHIIN